jgi:two-component system cell cycle response regulator
VTAVRALRRAFAVSLGALAGAAACAVVASGALDGASLLASPPALVPTAVLAGLLLLVVATLSRRLAFEAPTARAQRASLWLAAADDLGDVEVSLALVAATHAAVAVTGGADSSLTPLLYAVVAFAVTLSSRAGAIAAVVAAVLLEIAVAVRAPDWRTAAPPAAIHVAFLIGAAAAHALLLRGLARRLRRRQTEALARGFAAEREAARDYRLIASALGPSSRAPRSRDEEERLLAAGGAQIIGDAAGWVVATLKRWLGARTVALVWLADDERLVLREIASDADDVTERRQLGSAGVLAAVVRDRAPLLMAATKAGQLPYYEGRSGTGGAFLGVPVLEGPHLRGILCADRDRPFDEADRDLLLDACGQILRTVQSEHVFRAVERSKYEYERFYQAAALLGRALTPEQVMETAFDAAAAIVDYDAAVIALYQRDQSRHRVAAVRVRPGGEGVLDPRELDGLEFKDNAGLAAMVVKNRHYLPAGGEPREVSAPIYTRKVKLSDARSLLVLPLLSGEEAIGTFTLAARAEKRFGKDVREMLAVIGNQVAISLENGLLYKKMETMATTDGLTGLTNHRTFQDRFANLLERASRHGQKIAFLLCDVDFFKKVNDNYGHPTGDEVLRRVARVLGEVARKIDIPARYGGEEFAIVLDGTDVEQARQVAERVRQEISKLVIESEKGPFQVTMSIGVATFPDDGRDRAALIEHADHALYHAKHSGRNQVVTYPQYLAAKSGKTIEPPPAPKQRKAS